MAPPIGKHRKAHDSSSDDDDVSTSIGPALPPNFGHPDPDSSSSSDSSPDVGPTPPVQSTSAPVDVYGPALPPGLLQQQQPQSRPLVGPSLPPSGNVADYAVVPDEAGSEEDDDVIGPRPPGAGAGEYDVALEFEKRAQRMKQKLTSNNEEEKPQRAEWMLVLPPEMNKNFGMGPRSFLRQTPAPKGDRSGWTQTPDGAGDQQSEAAAEDVEDKKLVEDLARTAYNKSMNQRTEEINKSSKREKSLMEIHQKNLKRKKKSKKDDEKKSTERRPFDRDEDLKVNSFDEARRKALIKKSRQLDDKFSAGKSQFL